MTTKTRVIATALLLALCCVQQQPCAGQSVQDAAQPTQDAAQPTQDAAQPTLRQLFAEMPDSVVPYLSANNRLDMMDFMDSHMKAEVTNRLDGKSCMTALTADSIAIRLSEASRLDLLLLSTAEPVDSAMLVVAAVRTYGVDDGFKESELQFYSVRWRLLSQKPVLAAEAEERLKRVIEPSNVLKKISDTLNKN